MLCFTAKHPRKTETACPDVAFPNPCVHGSAWGRLRAELPAALGPAASLSIISTQRPRRARHLINAVVGLISSECVMPRAGPSTWLQETRIKYA